MTESILVVDDEHNFCSSIKCILEEKGYRVDIASTGKEAFARLYENPYDAILLDLVLPDIDGIEIGEYAASHQADTAIIVLTGQATVGSAVKAIRFKLDDYLSKPCKTELLLQTISRAIETKRLRKELVVSKRKFQQLAEATWEGIIIFSCNTVLQVNQQCLEIFGMTEKEITGQEIQDLIPGWDFYIPAQDLQEASVPETLELEAIRGDGRTVPVEIRIKKLANGDEKTWVAAIRDLTTRKQAEQRRLQMQEQLTNAQRMESIGIMAGSVAHDLNNILSSIVTFPELLLMDMSTSEKYRRDISLIQQAGKQAAAVVADLLTVARGSTCKKEPCNLNFLLKEYAQSIDFKQLRQFCPDIAIQLQLESNLPNIEASTIHITKSIINLVTNAAEAIGLNGKITIRTANRNLEESFDGYEKIPPGRYAVLSVQDTGPGIGHEALPYIFEPFFSKKELGRSGTGLGLTVIWNTVRDHQGYIDIISHEAGSRFELYFPSCRAETRQPGEFSFSLDTLYGRGESILVVDDEENQRQITSSILKRLGYTPFTVATGEMAVEYVQREPVDLLLLDMIMEPGISGYETYRQILEFQPGQKAVIASGYFNPEDQDKIRALGISQYLTKPFSITGLAQAVHMEIRR